MVLTVKLQVGQKITVVHCTQQYLTYVRNCVDEVKPIAGNQHFCNLVSRVWDVINTEKTYKKYCPGYTQASLNVNCIE